MRASMMGILLGAALVPAANAQTVIQRTITQEPVETTVTQTPAGTIVTRRPLGAEVVPNTVDAITTREVRRAEARRPAPRARRALTTRHVAARPAAKKVATVEKKRIPTRRVALTPAERHIVYQTIVEREVQPAPQVVAPAPYAPYALPAAPYALPAPSYVAPQPPLVSAQVGLPDGPVAAPAYAVGAVLPASVPLYGVPQEVALRVPAVQRYGYAYIGGRAYLVDPATGVIVEDVTE